MRFLVKIAIFLMNWW